jgi:hypothetical protein
MLAEPMKIQIITVSNMEGIETVNAVRKKVTAPCRFTWEEA